MLNASEQRPETADDLTSDARRSGLHKIISYRMVIQFISRFGLLSICAVTFIALLIASPTFRQPTNLLNILQQNATIGIVACGMVVVIISGGLDLSVGTIGASSAVIAAAGAVHFSVAAAILLALGMGVVVGAINGLLVARAGITPFIATLASSSVITGILFAETKANPVNNVPASLTNFGLGSHAGIPNVGIVFIAFAVLMALVLRYTIFGHYLFAVGSSPSASRIAGVPTRRVLIISYTLVGISAAVAGVLLLSQTGVGQPTAATDWPLSAIAAVVVGGTPLRGGVGGVYSAVVGTLLLGVLADALTIYGISPYWQPAVTGLVILAAVGIDTYQRKRREGTQ